MKKIYLLLSVVLLTFSACSSDDDPQAAEQEIKEASITATSRTTWHYYSFAQNSVVGTGEENEAENAKWAKRKDWDIAICKYSIRTNSGAATTVDANGGVFTCEPTVSFKSLTTLPKGITFAEDAVVESRGMGGVTKIVKSLATVITFKTNEEGNLVMPPVYLKAPVYIFRTAVGNATYKVEFTQYKNENSESGHVKFYATKLL